MECSALTVKIPIDLFKTREAMRVGLIIGLMLFMACTPTKTNKEIVQSSTVDSMSIATKDESFKNFFSKFKSDSLFQLQRIDRPLSVIFVDEASEEEKKMDIKYVSFSQKDWDVKIKYNTIEISTDTMNVILQGVDTGIHIDHLFAKRKGKWYLFQINNLSD